MPGQAAVTINENQWNVWVASTYAELTTGLSGVASLTPGTGMLFIFPAKQQVTVDTSQMLFPIDIIFISESLVIDVASDIQPGYLVTEETPCDMFLEINAGEAAGVEVGSAVNVDMLYTIVGGDLTQIMSFAIPLAALGFVCAMAGGVMKLAGGSSSSGTRELPPKHPAKKVTVKCPLCEAVIEIPEYDRLTRSEAIRKHIEAEHSHQSIWEEQTRFIGGCKVVNGLCHTHGYSVSKTVRCPKSPLANEEWTAAWELAEAAYPKGMSNPWVNGWWPETMEEAEGAANVYEWKMRDAIRMFREKQRVAIENYERGADKAINNYRRYVTGEYERGKELSVVASASGHHSMWLTTENRKDLEEKYGAVAVRWAEEATRPGDVKAAERAAEYYYKKIKEAFGLGHLSPELSEEQMRKLRELLGLPADVEEVLKIHRETGYVP